MVFDITGMGEILIHSQRDVHNETEAHTSIYIYAYILYIFRRRLVAVCMLTYQCSLIHMPVSICIRDVEEVGESLQPIPQCLELLPKFGIVGRLYFIKEGSLS